MMSFLASQVSCPYCYYKFDLRRVMFRCSGRPAPGRPACSPQLDTSRNDVLHDPRPALPSFDPGGNRLLAAGKVTAICPDCRGRTGIKVCPICHSALPPSFDESSPIIGVVGVKGAGKTVLLSVLAQELKTTVARRFSASINEVGDSALMGKLRQWRTAMDQGGELPPSTPQYRAGETVPAVLEWRYERARAAGRSSSEATVFSFYDTAGEDLMTTDLTRSQHYLGAADGLIVILDPFGFPGNAQRGRARGVGAAQLTVHAADVLGSVTTTIREVDGISGARKIKRPLAVAVSKIDAFFDQVGPDHPLRRPASTAPAFAEGESRDIHDYLSSLIHDWGGDDVLAQLDANYKYFRLVAVSALGAEPNYRAGAMGSNTGVSPYRVADPLLWLMAHRGFIPKVA